MTKGYASTIPYHRSLGVSNSDDEWLVGQDMEDNSGHIKVDEAPTTDVKGKRRASTLLEASTPTKKSKNSVQFGGDVDHTEDTKVDAAELSLGRFLKIAKKHPEQAAQILFNLESTKDNVQQLRDQVVKLVDAVVGLQGIVANSGSQPLQYPAPPAAPKSKEDRARLRWDEVQQKEEKKEKKNANRQKTQVKLKPRKSSVDDSDEDTDDSDDESPGPSSSKTKAERFSWSESWYLKPAGIWVGFDECSALATLCRDAFNGWHNSGKVDLVLQTWPNVSLALKIELCIIAEAAFPNISLCSLHYKFLLFAQTVFRAWRTKFLKTLKKSQDKAGKFWGAPQALPPVQVKQECNSQLPTPPSGPALFKMPEATVSPPIWTPAPNVAAGYSFDVSMDDSPLEINGASGSASVPAATPTPVVRTQASAPFTNGAPSLPFTKGTPALPFTLSLPAIKIPLSTSKTSEVSIPIDPELLAYDAAQVRQAVGPIPAIAKPVVAMPVAAQPAIAQPAVAPLVPQPVVAQPAATQPAVAQTFVTNVQTMVAQPAVAQPAVAQPPVIAQAATIQPAVTLTQSFVNDVQPAISQPAVAQPPAIQPVVAQSLVNNVQPIASQSPVGQPVMQPAVTQAAQPVVTNLQPVVNQPVVTTATQPAVAQPTVAPWLLSDDGPHLPGPAYQPNRVTYTGRNFYGHYWKKHIRPHGTTPENKWYWEHLGANRQSAWNVMAESFKADGKKIDKSSLVEICVGPPPV